MDQSPAETKEASVVDKAILDVLNGLSHAHDTLTVLERKLVPVLTPTPSSNANVAVGDAFPGISSPMTNELYGMTNNIYELEARIAALVSRVEL